MTTITTEPLLLSVTDAAAMLGVKRTTVYKLMAEGRLGSVKVGRRRLVPRAALEAFVAQLQEDAA